MLCLDASVVVRIATGTASPQLLELNEQWYADRERLIAPNLLGYEFTNSIYKLVRHGASPSVVGPAFETWRQMNIELVEGSDLHEEALALAIEYGIRASYDAHYLILAERRQSELYTCDRRFYNSLRGDWPQVRVVE